MLLIAAIGVALHSGTAKAQGPQFRPGPSGAGGGTANPSNSPSVSPYINLLRGGSQALNYYGLVRPAVDFQSSISNLQQDVNDLPAPGTGLGGQGGLAPLITGGNRVRFLNTGNYFLSGIQPGNLAGRNFGSGGMGGRGGGNTFIVNTQSIGGGQGLTGGGAGTTIQTPAAPR